MEPAATGAVQLTDRRHADLRSPVTSGSSGSGAVLGCYLAGDYEMLTVARRLDRMECECAEKPPVHPHELDLLAPGTVAFVVIRPRHVSGSELRIDHSHVE